MRLIQDSLHLHIHIRQVVHSPSRWKRITPWTQQTYSGIMLPLVTQWRARRFKLFPETDDHTNVLQLRGITLASVSGLPTHIDPTSLLDSILYSFMTKVFFDKRIRLLRHRLHGRFRSDLRSKMSKRVALMQEALELNKFRAVFQRVGLKPQQRLNLSYLQLPEDSITTNPLEIHEAHAAHFEAHHSIPSSLDPRTREKSRAKI